MRHAIRGLRPGESLHCAAGHFATSETDGGVNLTAKQVEALREAGYEAIPLEAPEPVKQPTAEEAEGLARAQQTIAENQEAAAKAEVTVPRKDKLKKA